MYFHLYFFIFLFQDTTLSAGQDFDQQPNHLDRPTEQQTGQTGQTNSLQDLCLRNIIWFSNRKICVALKRAVLNLSAQTVAAYLALCLEVFFGKRTAWMLGRTPPCAMVTPERSLFNSSSLRIANCK